MKLNKVNGCNDFSFGGHCVLETAFPRWRAMDNIAGVVIIITIRVMFIQLSDCVYIVESQPFVVPIISEVESLTLFPT